MNIAVIIPSLDKYGGAERVVVQCLRDWQHRHDITVYATAINDDLLKEHGVVDVRRVILAPYFDGERGFLLNAVLLPKLWRRQIGRHELYHTHLWPTHLIDLHPMVWYPHEPLRALHDLRFDVDVAGGRIDMHIYPKRAYDTIDAVEYAACLDAIEGMDRVVTPERIVANSRFSAKILSEIYGRSVTDVVYPGVEATQQPELKRDPGLFVTISQLWSHKRVRILIEAIALTDETQLLIMGSGPEKPRLQELVQRLGLDDRVFFLEGLSNNELSLVLARACGFLFAPNNEPFGIVVLEAMNAALPVIAVAEGGYVECCTPSTAFLIPPFPSAFAEKIALLQANAALAKRMGRAAQEQARRFTWARTSNELEAILIETQRAHPPVDMPSADESRTLFGIQYYLWYGEGFGAAHWNDDKRTGHVSDHPLIGYYGSAKGETIRFHLGLFEQMDIDFALLNLHLDEHGLNDVESQSIHNLFEVAAQRGGKLRFAVQLAPYTDHLPTIEGAIAQVKADFAASPAYLRLAGKPALFWFWSSALDRRKDLISPLSRATDGFQNFALGLRPPDPLSERDLTFGWFEGFAPFSPLELAAEEKWHSTWNTAYAAAERAGMRYRIACLSPGYDDQSLDDPRRRHNRQRQVPRRDGATYGKSMAWVESLSAPPHLAIISTFNEMHENTHIEPSLRNGTRYIEMTRDFIARMRQAQKQIVNAN